MRWLREFKDKNAALAQNQMDMTPNVVSILPKCLLTVVLPNICFTLLSHYWLPPFVLGLKVAQGHQVHQVLILLEFPEERFTCFPPPQVQTKEKRLIWPRLGQGSITCGQEWGYVRLSRSMRLWGRGNSHLRDIIQTVLYTSTHK